MQTAGLKVLIIEERRENIVFLANNIFKPKGFEIITARDGKSGLRKALEVSPDLILVDLNVPKMRALDIMADLNDRGANIPFIVMTLHGSEAQAVQSFRLGAKDYLLKPIQTVALEEAIERALKPVLANTPCSQNQIANLEQKIKDLEQTVAEQKKLLASYTGLQTTNTLPKQMATKEAELNACHQECERLNALIAQQNQQLQAANNQTKALMQFVNAQQKILSSQQQDTDKLIRQTSTLSNNISKLVTRFQEQADQYALVVPTTEMQEDI